MVRCVVGLGLRSLGAPLSILSAVRGAYFSYALFLQTGDTTKTGAPVEQFGEGREVCTSPFCHIHMATLPIDCFGNVFIIWQHRLSSTQSVHVQAGQSGLWRC